MGEIFPVVKSQFDVPKPERKFYQDQCLEEPTMTISEEIDKKQTKRNLKVLKTKNLLNQTYDKYDIDQEDKDDDQDGLFVTENESTTTSDTGDNDSVVSMFEGPSTSTSTKTYFTKQLTDLGAAAGISDDKLSRVLTEYEAAKGSDIIVTKKKILF